MPDSTLFHQLLSTASDNKKLFAHHKAQ